MIKFIFKRYKDTQYYIVNEFLSKRYKRGASFECVSNSKNNSSFDIWYVIQELKNRNLKIEIKDITDDENIAIREIIKQVFMPGEWL